jgi:transcriptional regulator with GAF, ATPase, and Fis domain
MKAIDRSIPNIFSSAVRCVFVGGESGTGKEVVVSLMERHLKRDVIKINCSALQESLAESILFGHVRGAFTGALQDKMGLFEAAHGSWIFLDEVGSLSPALQSKVLRVIENNEIVKIGETRQTSLDLKFIFAAHGDFKELISKGSFRNDLWQRMSEYQIYLPPLRERRAEINDLIEHFCKTEEGGPYMISYEAKAILGELPWHEGNVRQLRNCIRAMTTKQVDRLLTPLSIPRSILQERGTRSFDSTVTIPISDDEQFDELELKFLVECCRARLSNNGSLSKAAESLGIPKSTLSRKLKDARAKGILTVEQFNSWTEQKK